MCPNEPRPTGLVGYPRHEKRRAKICQDEWRAWRHRGLVVWDALCDAGRWKGKVSQAKTAKEVQLN